MVNFRGFLTILFASIVGLKSVQGRVPEPIWAIHKSCIADAGMPEEIIIAYIKHKIPSTELCFKKYLLCSMSTFGVYDLTTHKVIQENLKAAMPHNDPYYDEILAAIDSCGTPPGADDLEIVYNTQMCYLSTLGQEKMIFLARDFYD